MNYSRQKMKPKNELSNYSSKSKLDSHPINWLSVCGLCSICRWKDKVGNLYVISRRNGKLLTIGPHWPGILVIKALIIGGTFLNLNILAQKVFPVYAKLLLKLFIYFMAFLTFTLLIFTSVTDPGIMVSNQLSAQDDFDDNFNININSDVEVNDNQYCDICDIFQNRALSIRHCEDCNVCIRGHDHHCPWVGKCIGEYNFRYFVFFNISWLIYVVELMILTFVF